MGVPCLAPLTSFDRFSEVNPIFLCKNKVPFFSYADRPDTVHIRQDWRQ
jgi:hypothetical protein